MGRAPWLRGAFCFLGKVSFTAGNPCRVIRELTEQDSMRNKPEILVDNQVIE